MIVKPKRTWWVYEGALVEWSEGSTGISDFVEVWHVDDPVITASTPNH